MGELSVVERGEEEIDNQDTCYSSGSFHLLEYDMPCVSIDGIYLDNYITK